MLRKVFSKVLSHSDVVVRRGANDVREGKQSLPADAFAQRGRDTQQKPREEKRK